MECSICQRHFNARRKPSCVSCTQALIHQPRIDQAAALLGREKSHTHAEAVVRPGNDGVIAALPEDADWDAITAGISTHSVERRKAEKKTVDARVADITSKAEELQRQIDEYKKLRASQKQINERRRQDIVAERKQLEERRLRALEPVQTAIRKAKHRLDKTHGRIADARELLCKEVGAICGLHRARDKRGRSMYYLDGHSLPNLKDLNCINGRIRGEKIDATADKLLLEPHELVSASLDNVCRFLGLCCHYLSIRLPAEIALAHKTFPHSAILPRDISYKGTMIPYPALGPGDPSLTRSALNEGRKARLLHLDRPLMQLQKEDLKAYELFIEGVMLLAYDIAWLCRALGMEETPGFDGICDIGKNLHFIVGQLDKTARPPLSRATTATTDKSEKPLEKKHSFGYFSHGSVANSLAGHTGAAMFAPDAWKVSVTSLTVRLTSHLRNEAARSEWDIIDDREWDQELEHERPVMIGPDTTRSINAQAPAMSVMTFAPHDGAEDSSDPAKDNAKRGKGWMKVRGRGGDA